MIAISPLRAVVLAAVLGAMLGSLGALVTALEDGQGVIAPVSAARP